MKIRPLQDRLIVKRYGANTESKGGIIIPDNAQEKPAAGEIVAVGNGRMLPDGSIRPLDLRVGDRVLFSKYAGTEVKLGEVEHLMLREEDIFGVIEEA